MKVCCALFLLVAMFTLNCGGGDQPPPQDPSTATSTGGGDADAGTPAPTK